MARRKHVALLTRQKPVVSVRLVDWVIFRMWVGAIRGYDPRLGTQFNWNRPGWFGLPVESMPSEHACNR